MAAPKNSKAPEAVETKAAPKRLAKASALDRAKAYSNRRQSHKKGHVANQEPGWHYYWFDFSGGGDRGNHRAQLMRYDLRERGFEPVNGPLYEGEARSELVVGVPNAELWRCEQEVADFYFRQRKARALADPNWLRLQQGRIQRSGAFVPTL